MYSCLGLVSLLVCGHESGAQGPEAQAGKPTETVEFECTLDLASFGAMEDIVSNALLRGFRYPRADVVEFLAGARSTCADGNELIKATADRFKITEERVSSEVERFRHCNCTHIGGGEHDPDATPEPEVEISKFAMDVTIHVVLHELGHALIREFDLPVLANEEAAADAFATHFLTTHLPDIAFDVLSARTKSLMLEAEEVPRENWSVDGEHNSDARRACQIAALAVAADPDKYDSLAAAIGMSPSNIRSAKDYGTEIHRSWRRLLEPLWLPSNTISRESRLKVDSESPLIAQLASDGVIQELFAAIQRFDWHSQVTLHFSKGKGGAGWSRSKRTITVHSGYVHRFVMQGERREH